MTDYSIQHFTFKRGKIYVRDWLQTKPYDYPDAVDSYYALLAERVANTLQLNPLCGYFDEDEDILMTAIGITGWFEDLCSGLGIWRTVNEECLKRYGQMLPFYDMEVYYPGEVNVQDIRLLLWDYIQSYHKNKIINPENPYIESCAVVLGELFDEEYETAPENVRLYDFVQNPLAAKNIWEARGLITWLHFRSYIGHAQALSFKKTVNDINKNEKPDYRGEYKYAISSGLSMTERANILSLKSSQWISRLRMDKPGKEVFANISYTSLRPYRLLSLKAKGAEVQDLYTDKTVMVDKYSFQDYGSLKEDFQDKGYLISMALVNFNGRSYMCGSMIGGESNNKLEDNIAEEKKLLEVRNGLKETHRRFLKANRNRPYLLLKDVDELKSFFIDKLRISGDYLGDMTRMLKGISNFILFSDPVNGFCHVRDMAPCIASRSNRMYDKEYAKANAHSLIVDPDCLCYTMSCYLQDKNLIPDAKLNSIKGEAHGRKLLHHNGQFFADYFFNCNREDDYDEAAVTGISE